MPEKYVSDFVDQGTILFRNLSYFQQGPESDQRTDQFDGKSIYTPDKPFDVENLNHGTKFTASEMHDTVDSERVFIFCCSKKLKLELFERFECDCAVEIQKPLELVNRVKRKLGKSTNLSKLFYDDVKYYSPLEEVTFEFKDPYKIPLEKRRVPFGIEEEYRLFFVEGDRLLKSRTVRMGASDISGIPPKRIERGFKIQIGSISDFSKVHKIEP